MKIVPNIRFSAAMLLGGMFLAVSTHADTVINQDLIVEGEINANFEGVNDTGDGLTKLADLSANNTTVTPGKGSDAGFSIFNEKLAVRWNFRTLGQNFAVTKEGTGGAEFTMINPTSDDASQVSISVANGAFLGTDGIWTTPSSRDYKENIKTVTSAEAIAALKSIKPVKYNYKKNVNKELHLGFIAEDVPELVSTPGKKRMETMEVVAMLTKVVQEQQNALEAQQNVIEQQRRLTEELTDKVTALEKLAKLSSLVAMQ